MKISNVLILLGAVIAGIWVVPALVVKGQQPAPGPRSVQDHRRIVQTLEEQIPAWNVACVDGGNEFPYDSRHAGMQCRYCEDFERAGLVIRSMREEQQHGRLAVITRFELTEAGQASYDPAPANRAWRSQFCFGHGRLHEVRAIREIAFPGAIAYVAQYVIAIEDPHPLLFDERSRALKFSELLPVPLARGGEPLLLPPATVRLVRMIDGSMDFQ